MNSIAFNAAAIPHGAVIPLLVPVPATPLACAGSAGLVALPLSFAELRLRGTALTVLIFSSALQGAATIILTLLPRRA
jgi:hypothetical protein